MPPRISVITVVRNGERYLADALRSVLAQTLPPDEIIVVDGQSTDTTADIARSFPGVSVVRQDSLGLANARNLGLDVARGEWIAFLDHDDIWTPDKLQRQVAVMQAQPALQYTTTLLRFLVEDGAAPRSGAATGPPETPREGATPSALVVRRELFTTLGRFDPAYAIGCDADWFTRARDHAIPTAVVPHVLLYKRLHTTNLSVNAVVNRQDMFRIAKASIARQRRR